MKNCKAYFKLKGCEIRTMEVKYDSNCVSIEQLKNNIKQITGAIDVTSISKEEFESPQFEPVFSK